MKGWSLYGLNALALWIVLSQSLLSPRVAAQSPGGLPEHSISAAGQAPLAWDAMTKEYKAKPGETTNMFVFSVTNISAFPVEVTQMRPSCGCTVAKLPKEPWRLAPGSNGLAYATIDFGGKYGMVKKSIAVAGSHITPSGTVKFIQDLFIVVHLPFPTNAPGMTNAAPGSSFMPDRNENMELARHDRQAVFKGDCAVCHAMTAKGKTGEELFHAVCGICHESQDRATIVPDLAVAKTPRNEAYWLSWIKFGKGGTLMPGFLNSSAVGGPLDTNQIQSLAAYALKKYPTPASARK